MKYYLIKLVESLPNGFGGTAQGPLIKLLPKYQHDVGLIEHEKTHVRQWYALMALGLSVCALLALLALLASPGFWIGCVVAPLLHPLLYKFIRPYRLWSEVRAYRKQIAVGGYVSNAFAVAALVDKYGLSLSIDEAKALLFD